MVSAKEAFSERLKELLEDKDVSQARLAKAMETTPQAISSYVKGKTTPDYDMLCSIAEYFGVTTDYLLGVSHTLSDEESAILDEMKSSGAVDFNFLRAFRQTKVIRDNLRKLYSGNLLEAFSDNALTLQFVSDIHAVCEKYSAISQIFGYHGTAHPEHIGQFDAFNTDFTDKLHELMQDPSFRKPSTEPTIISELIRMEQALK